MREGEWDIPLRHSLHGASLIEWNELMALLQDVLLDEQEQDKVIWALEKSSEFSTNHYITV